MSIKKFILESFVTEGKDNKIDFIESVLKDKTYKTFDELKEGDEVVYVGKTKPMKVVRKFKDSMTARSGVKDFELYLSKTLEDTYASGLSFANSLPLVAVKDGDEFTIHLYAPDKYTDVDTLICFKK